MAEADNAGRERARLTAWAAELQRVHSRLRQALRVAHDAALAGSPPAAARREPQLLCYAFCAALTRHHEGEAGEVAPTIAAEHPALGEPLRGLMQDHPTLSHPAARLRTSARGTGTARGLAGQVEGIAA